MTRILFTKMVGTGNDFVVVDARRARAAPLARSWPPLAKAMCDRRCGIGADGLLVLEPSQSADARMRVFNADGSEAEMCGNGARCVAFYVDRVRRAQRRGGRRSPAKAASTVSLETKAGLYHATVKGSIVEVRMTDPTDVDLERTLVVGGRELRVGFVNTGVPHAIVPVAGLNQVDVEGLGRTLRFHDAFGPRGTNVNFIEEDTAAPDRLRVRTYERGVEGETLACGTGVTASAVVHALRHRGDRPAGANGSSAIERTISVQTKSGETLTVRLRCAPGPGSPRVSHVMLSGAVRWICEGVYERANA